MATKHVKGEKRREDRSGNLVTLYWDAEAEQWVVFDRPAIARSRELYRGASYAEAIREYRFVTA
jgi:hypothetical protein